MESPLQVTLGTYEKNMAIFHCLVVGFKKGEENEKEAHSVIHEYL